MVKKKIFQKRLGKKKQLRDRLDLWRYDKLSCKYNKMFFSQRHFCDCHFFDHASPCCALQKDKTEPFSVSEVVQEMPRDQRQTLWGKLSSILQGVLQELPPERWDEPREEGMEVESAVDPVR